MQNCDSPEGLTMIAEEFAQTPIVIYQSADSSTTTEVRVEGESVW